FRPWGRAERRQRVPDWLRGGRYCGPERLQMRRVDVARGEAQHVEAAQGGKQKIGRHLQQLRAISAAGRRCRFSIFRIRHRHMLSPTATQHKRTGGVSFPDVGWKARRTEVHMERIICDVAIIGAGTAGLTAERAASGEGATTCLIEAGPGGTTCARVGCMPSKLLISAADAAHAAAGAATFGVHPENVRIDGRQVMARVREQRDRFVDGVFRGIEKYPPTHFRKGHARFLDETTLMVGDATRVEARAIVLAVGSRPSVPEPLSHLGSRLLTSETVFELED